MTGIKDDEPVEVSPKNEGAAALGRLGAAARAKALSPERRREIASKAAQERWKRP